jgi:small subunit ribosomal protein S7
MRGQRAPKRPLLPDALYANINVAKLIHYVMRNGKKSVAQSVVYGAFRLVEEQTKKSPVEIFDAAIKKISPSMEVKSRRVGGANYQIPIPVRSERRFYLSCKWILEAARAKKGKRMAERLAQELLSAAQGTGDAFKKRTDVQRMADANRAFAHFGRRR